jgi:hypothetical protein
MTGGAVIAGHAGASTARAHGRRAWFAAAAAACAFVLAWPPSLRAVPAPADAASSAAPASEPISEAEQLLFIHPHLATVHAPRTLTYAWSAQTAASASAPDRATLALRPRADGTCCAVHGEYLSGEMAVQLPDFDDATANPILLYFLESEVRRLQRTTHGQSAHFRRQIRIALATDARVTDATVRWNGKDVPGHAVRVAPFLDDPYRSRFEREAATEYVFLLSDEVPGGVAAMSATLPDADAKNAPLELRRLVLEDPQPAPPAKP